MRATDIDGTMIEDPIVEKYTARENVFSRSTVALMACSGVSCDRR